MKIITAKLREEITVCVEIDDLFKKYDWLQASAIIEDRKKDLVQKLKTELHQKVATLSEHDVDIKII